MEHLFSISAGERPAAARLLRSWVRIPPEAWIFVCCECRVLSGRGLCDELITRPEESCRLCCVVVCDLETSRMGDPYIYIYIYIYDISRLRVNVTGRGGEVAAGRGGCSFLQQLDFIATLTTFFAISCYIPLIPVFVFEDNALFVAVFSSLVPTSTRNLQPYEVRFKIHRES